MSVPLGHRTAELRSIALHRRVGELVALDPARSDLPRARVAQWLADGGPVPPADARLWDELLHGPLDVLRSRLVEDSERMRDARQNTPFAGVVDERERQAIVRAVR